MEQNVTSANLSFFLEIIWCTFSVTIIWIIFTLILCSGIYMIFLSNISESAVSFTCSSHYHMCLLGQLPKKSNKEVERSIVVVVTA